jgi:hypothetical protein
MTRELRLLAFILVLAVHPLMMGLDCGSQSFMGQEDLACDAYGQVPSGDTGQIFVPAGGYALVRISCTSLDGNNAQTFVLEEGSGSGYVEPIAQVYDHPDGKTTGYILLLKGREDAPLGPAEVTFRVIYAAALSECNGICNGEGSLKFTIVEPTASATDMISLSPEPNGGIRVVSATPEQSQFSWVAEGLVPPVSVPFYVPVPDEDLSSYPNPNFIADKTTFIDYPKGEKKYRLVALRTMSSSRYEVSFDEVPYKPLTVEIVTTPEGTIAGAATTLTVDVGTDVALEARVSGGLLDPGFNYNLVWSGSPRIMRTSQGISVRAESDLMLTVEARDSMDNLATATANIRLRQTMAVLTVETAGPGLVNSDPAGINCGAGSDCVSEFALNSEVILTARGPHGAPMFSGGCVPVGTAEEGKARVLMDGSKLCQVTFPEETTGPLEVLCQASEPSTHVGVDVSMNAMAFGFVPNYYEWSFSAAAMQGQQSIAQGQWWPSDGAGVSPALTNVEFLEEGPVTVYVRARNTETAEEAPPGQCSLTVQ